MGDEARLTPLLEKLAALKAASEIRHTPDAVAMDDKPSHALRSGRDRGRTTSMWQAIATVKSGEANARHLAGNTGVLMAMAKLQLKTMTGIERPAIAALWPTVRGETVVLDVGANVGLDERQLVDFAILGEAYARVVLGLERPSVALLNIGAEEMKGTEAVKAAAADIRDSGIDMNFQGFVEGVDISMGQSRRRRDRRLHGECRAEDRRRHSPPHRPLSDERHSPQLGLSPRLSPRERCFPYAEGTHGSALRQWRASSWG